MTKTTCDPLVWKVIDKLTDQLNKVQSDINELRNILDNIRSKDNMLKHKPLGFFDE